MKGYPSKDWWVDMCKYPKGIVSMLLTFDEDQNQALENFARVNGWSKSRACSEILEQWLKDNGYLDPESTGGYNI